MISTFLYLLVSFLSIGVSFSQDCGLIIPPEPLTPYGLSTPYILVSLNDENPCSVLIPETSAFVEATILDLDSGDLSVYYPLVVDNIAQVAIDPVVPVLPKNSVIGLWMSSNSRTIRLIIVNENSNVNCVDGNIFGKYAYCNASEFFSSANNLITKGVLKIPEIGVSNKGDVCPTTRHYGVIQEYNGNSVISSYILTNQYTVAQNTRDNRRNLNVLDIINSGTQTYSTNRLLISYINPAISCKSLTAPNLIDLSESPSIALNELSANVNQKIPEALIPSGDKSVLVNSKLDLYKLNLYRVSMNQPTVNIIDPNDNNDFCNNLAKITGPFLFLHYEELSTNISPNENISVNLLNFLASRFVKTWNDLSCDKITGEKSPIEITLDSNGMVLSSNIIQKYGATTDDITRSNLVYFLIIFFSVLIVLVCVVISIIYIKKSKSINYAKNKKNIL